MDSFCATTRSINITTMLNGYKKAKIEATNFTHIPIFLMDVFQDHQIQLQKTTRPHMEFPPNANKRPILCILDARHHLTAKV